MRIITTLVLDERGQGFAEYSLLLSLIAIACIAAMETFGLRINTTLEEIGTDLL